MAIDIVDNVDFLVTDKHVRWRLLPDLPHTLAYQ